MGQRACMHPSVCLDSDKENSRVDPLPRRLTCLLLSSARTNEPGNVPVMLVLSFPASILRSASRGPAAVSGAGAGNLQAQFATGSISISAPATPADLLIARGNTVALAPQAYLVEKERRSL